MRLLKAMLIAPLAALPAMVMAALLRGWTLDGARVPFFLVHLSFAYAAALVFGLPLHLLLRRAGRDEPWIYGVLGCVIGAVVAATAEARTTLQPADWIASVLAGGLGGLMFRALAGVATLAQESRPAIPG